MSGHTPGPTLTTREAMDLAVLATVEANKLRDTGRPCFVEQADRMEALARRLTQWVTSPPVTELTIDDINALPIVKSTRWWPMNMNNACVRLAREAGRAAIAKATGAQS